LIKRALGWAGLLALAALLAVAGYWLLFTYFMGYDDEGYVLLSLRNYAAHGALYDRVFSQYGPFFFAAFDALHRLLGFAWTNTSGRFVTLTVWGATALGSGLLVWRRSRSTAATALTVAGVFTYLWVMIHEPTHPGGLIGLLVALAAWLGVEADPAEKPGAAAALGALAAAIALTKINVGVFMFAAAGVWLLLAARDARVRRIGRWGLAACVVLMPWGLMHALLPESWVVEYAALFVLAALGVLVVLEANPVPVAGWRVVAALAGGAAGVTLLTVGVTLARGSSVAGLLDGVLLNPLRQPGVYNFAFPWRPGSLATAAVALGIVVAARRRPASRRIAGLVVTVRLLAMAVLVLAALVGAQGLGEGPWRPPDLAQRFFSLLGWEHASPAAFGMSFGVGLAALCALPLRHDEEGRKDARARQWLALVLVFQFLHAYPVAGSQLNWGTFLWVPLLILAVRDAWRYLPAWRWQRAAAATAALGAFGLSGVMGYTLLRIGLGNRAYGEPLGLPGAERIGVPDDTVFGLRIMAENARAHADMLFSLSGLYSFNLWTGLPTPTLANATQWFESLSTPQQQAIVDRLRADPRAALIVQLDTFGLLSRQGFHARGVLADYLWHDFQRAFTVDGYSFWVHRGRRIAELSTGRLLAGATSGAGRLELVLAAPPRPIGRVEVWQLGSGARRHVATLTAANARLDVTPLSPDGTANGPIATDAWMALLPAGIIRAGIEFPVAASWPPELVAFVFDAAGNRMAAARVLP